MNDDFSKYAVLLDFLNHKLSIMAKIKITQVKSEIDRSKRQKATLIALGLRRINQTVVHENTPQIAGMVKKVAHLVKTSEA